MATNNFKSFASASGANVTPQADYEALPAVSTGFQSGKASSSQVNKALRQCSTMSALLGQFINAAGLDALDNGNLTALLANFNAALSTNLSLGSASKRNVGIGVNQIPDMSYFASNQTANGYQKLPGGLIIQWGTTGFSAASTGIATTTFPIMFPNACLQISLTEMTTISGSTPYTGINAWGSDTTLTTSGFNATCANRISQAAAVAEAARYIAIGY